MSAEQAAEAARGAARESLLRLAGRDRAVFASYVTAWMVRNLTLDQLADLVEQLDRAFPQPWTDTGSGPGWPLLGTSWERHDDPEQQP